MSTTDLTIEQFEAGLIEPGAFTHEAHVFVAWLYVMEFGPSDAISRFDAALLRWVEKLGAEPRYNAMITWLFMKLVGERARVGEDWSAFLARNRDLIDDRPCST